MSGLPEIDAIAVLGRRVATERRLEGVLDRGGGASATAGLGTHPDAAAMASQHRSSLLIDCEVSATARMCTLIRFRSPWNPWGRCCHRASISAICLAASSRWLYRSPVWPAPARYALCASSQSMMSPIMSCIGLPPYPHHTRIALGAGTCPIFSAAAVSSHRRAQRFTTTTRTLPPWDIRHRHELCVSPIPAPVAGTPGSTRYSTRPPWPVTSTEVAPESCRTSAAVRDHHAAC